MAIMTNVLEENDIDVPYFVRREERKLSLEHENGKHMHVLSAREKPISNVYVSYLFFNIYSLIYNNLKPQSLPCKKPQIVHQSFLQNLVIFH